jgi:thiamine biosynthesis lipoprotein
MSDYRDDSEIAELARRAGGPAQPVSPDLFRVLEKAVAIAEASDGAFDPTVGPLVALWRAARRDRRLPDSAALEEARKRTGVGHLELNGGIRTVTMPHGARLDLGGIGKGFACDEAVRVLRDLGYPHALVSLAGDVVAGDPPPGQAAWSVAIGKGGRTEPVANAGISTSGDAEQFVEIGGVRYSHILDPRTGLGLTGSTSATVIASDGMTADALATAACVLGEEKGRALVNRYPGARVVAFESR